MHELAVCQGLMRQVEEVAARNNAVSVERVLLRVGGLSGVEPALLQSAFEIARAGTIASEAELEIEHGPIVVKCQECGASSAAKPNRLLCQYCGEWRVNVVEGEELLLLSLDIETKPQHSEAEEGAVLGEAEISADRMRQRSDT